MNNANNFMSREKSTLTKLVRLIQEDPLSHKEASNGDQELIWYINSIENKKEFNYLIRFITRLGFRLTREEPKSYSCRHIFSKDIALHITILQFVDKYTLNAHIDVGIHEGIIRNRLTVELLSELHSLLKQRYPTIPILLKSFSQPRRFASKKEGAKQLIGPEYMQRKIGKVVNKITPLVIIEATRESLQVGEVISKERIKSIILNYLKSDSDLDLDNNLIRNKLEILIHKNLDHIIEKIRYGYQKQQSPPKKRLVKTKRKAAPQAHKSEPDGGYIRKRYRLDDSDALSWSRRVSREPIPPSGVEIIPEASDHTREIKKYVVKFCRSILATELTTLFMNENEMRKEMKKQFDLHLKTKGHTTRDRYKTCFSTYLKEWFPQEYNELVNELYDTPAPPREPAPDLVSIIFQWANEKKIRYLILFLVVLSILIISPLLVDHKPSYLIFYIILIGTIIILTNWIGVSFTRYYYNRFIEKGEKTSNE